MRELKSRMKILVIEIDEITSERMNGNPEVLKSQSLLLILGLK